MQKYGQEGSFFFSPTYVETKQQSSYYNQEGLNYFQH